MKTKTYILIGAIIILIVVIGFDFWVDSKNPSPKWTTCPMDEEEQKQAYENYLSFLDICHYQSNYTMEFLGIKESFRIKYYGYDECNDKYCCIDFKRDELVHCRDKNTGEVKIFKQFIEYDN